MKNPIYVEMNSCDNCPCLSCDYAGNWYYCTLYDAEHRAKPDGGLGYASEDCQLFKIIHAEMEYIPQVGLFESKKRIHP